jgi:signal recognition particle receptor subunit beta
MRAVIGHSQLRHVAFCGPYGVGKTTAVRVVSDTPVVNTDVSSGGAGLAPRPGSPRKLTTTVGIDYGEWTAPDGARVAVLGTPGQERFATLRKNALTRGSGIVLWLFGDKDYAVDEGEEWINFLGDSLVWHRLTVAVTRYGERADAPPLAAYRRMMDTYDRTMGLALADPRERADVEQVLQLALHLPDTAGKTA